MAQPAVSVEDISKVYRIRRSAGGYGTDLRTDLLDGVRSLWKRGTSRPAYDEFWALRGASFEVQPGEVVGLMGSNGAGKSTLLKILARVVRPTAGRAVLRGRVGSLLEVGTGFHPDLTGRENVFLAGAILGLSRSEIRGRFDEIVDFAEIESFLDTPVKRYSSGMYTRLAFAVAAHLDADILLVDEVLAVGDAAFQRKCLGRMGDVAGQGRTVVFVSHSVSAVRSLCTRGVLLRDGVVVHDGPVEEAVEEYLRRGDAVRSASLAWDGDDAPGDDGFRLRSISLLDAEGRVREVLDARERLFVQVDYDLLRPHDSLRVGLVLSDGRGETVFGATDLPARRAGGTGEPGRWRSVCEIPSDLLNRGPHTLQVAADRPPASERVCTAPAIQFDVEFLGERNGAEESLPGVVRPNLRWSVERVAP